MGAPIPDSPVAEDVEVETVEAERVLTMVELAGRPIADQLAALNGGPVRHRSPRKSCSWVQRIASLVRSQVRGPRA